tara:strand:+ start:2113 stop:2325 length:213 start_codon:yes stop_codon:yes gene_type:complete
MITENDVLRDNIADLVLPRLNDMLSDELNHIQDDLKLSNAMLESLCYSWLETKIRIIEFGTFEYFRKKEK